MEQKISKWFMEKGKTPVESCMQKLAMHAGMVFDGNRIFNLTGFQSLDEIVDNLELDSLAPFLDMDVPRGTRVADCGTGAGYPGIPFAVYFEGAEVVLFDSSEKKCDFLETVVESLDLSGVEIVPGRIEEEIPRYRESFDMVISRAMAQYYVSIEICAPLLRNGGVLYLFARENAENLPAGILEHARELGLEIMSGEEMLHKKIAGPGVIFVKRYATPERFPRRYPVIKREAKRFEIEG